MLKSLRYRVLFWLLAFVAFTASFIIPLNFFINQKKDKINSAVEEINLLHIQLLSIIKKSDNFLFAETVNPEFFITGKSNYLTERQNLTDDFKERVSKLKTLENPWPETVTGKTGLIEKEFETYNVLFDSLVYLVFKRGYKNFGLEGEMIDYVSQLEKTKGIDRFLLLQIRRNEKDYLLRKEGFYYDNFERLTKNLIRNISRSKALTATQKRNGIELINDYSSTFKLLVEIENKIGLHDNTGLKLRLNASADLLEYSFRDLQRESGAVKKALLRELNVYYSIFMAVALIISVIISFFISRYVLIHLEKLTQYISRLTANNFIYHERIDLKNPASEITQIYKEFRNMVSQLHVRQQQRDKALKNAEDNELKFRELADMLPQSIYETDELGNFTYVNKAFYKNFGYTREDLKEGLNLIETVISETTDDIMGKVRLENSNFLAIRKDGSRFPASVYSDNIIKNNTIAGKRGIIIDVTEQKTYIRSLKTETRKAQTSDKLKSSFLANMSHEIRTPMNSIIGFSNLLASDEIPEEQKKDFINYIRSSGEMLLNLIDDIIDIAKIEAGELKINKKELNVNELFSELYKTFDEIKCKAGKEQIALVMNKEMEQHVIKTDPFRLKQIISNLIGNAIKFTEKGSVEFGYRLKDEKRIEFYVKDTGVGLSKEELGIIFERFKRTSNSEEKNIVGTGLGLAISKNLVELMGGDMWVDSAPGSGTTFFFTLPYLKTTAMIASNAANDQPESYFWPDKTILVVEDDEQSYHFLQELLKRTGVSVTRARNGLEAIELCKNNDAIDLVLMDIQLPKMNGYDATREIKKTRKNLPVIAQTAYAMSGDREKSILSGCDDYIAKPLSIETLLPKINQFIPSSFENNQKISRNSMESIPANEN
ncbi:MAG: response regulator [Bacteroidales bacterium]|nr:response regulator [Bacteroidales bacterium]